MKRGTEWTRQRIGELTGESKEALRQAMLSGELASHSQVSNCCRGGPLQIGQLQEESRRQALELLLAG